METYIVSSGSIVDYKLKAKTRKLAAIHAIDRHSKPSLGRIVEVIKEGEDEGDYTYYATTNLLKEMGYQIDEKQAL